MTATAPSVPNAHAGPISDPALEQIIAAGHVLQTGTQPTESDLWLILMSAPQMAEELLQRRRAMEIIEDCSVYGNVTFLKSS